MILIHLYNYNPERLGCSISIVYANSPVEAHAAQILLGPANVSTAIIPAMFVGSLRFQYVLLILISTHK